MRAMPRVLSLLLLSVLPVAALAQSVLSFAPQGEVKRVRQATARFASPMVAFGDLRARDPFTVACPHKGTGRWVDATTWAYDFEHDLPGAVACRFTLRDDSRDLAGQALAGARQFAFSTGGPAVVASLPYEGSDAIDERQAFVLALDAPAREDSVARHAWCRVDGVGERIGVRLLAGAERDAILGAQRDFVDDYLTGYFRQRGLSWRRRAPLAAHQGQPLPLAVLQCQRPLPASTAVALVWGAGIAAPNGVASAADQALAFKTRPEFSARVRCERVNARAHCIPFQPVRLELTAPVAIAAARAAYLTDAAGKRYGARFDEEQEKAEFVRGVRFDGPFPAQATLTLHLPPELKDDAGRMLLNRARFPMPVRTGEQPPLVKFAAPFGIIESRGERMLPVTVRNVEPRIAATIGTTLRMGAGQEQEVIAWLKKLAGTRGSHNWDIGAPAGSTLERSLVAGAPGTEKFVLPKPNGGRAFEVIGIPLRKSGFYVVELSSPKLGAAINRKGRNAYVRSAALVTNMAAHFKHGAQSSLVWVTSLDKGRPVARAQVAVRDCAGKLLWSGQADASGIARIGKPLPPSRCRGNHAYFISARSGEDFTFTLSDWDQGIEPWRFNLPTASLNDDSRIVSTVFDRTLLRAGETVHMKHFLRRRTTRGLALVKAGDAAPRDRDRLPETGWLVHRGSYDELEFPLRWDAAGNAHAEWAIPAEAKLGVYEVVIGGQVSGEFRVEQYRVPLTTTRG